MTDVVAIAALVVAALALALAGYQSYKLAQSKDAEADARALAAQREGEAKVDAVEVTDANRATSTAIDAERAQEKRGDALEKELSDASTRPVGASGVDELRTEVSRLPHPGATPRGGSPIVK